MKRGEEGNVDIGQEGKIKTPDLPIDQQGKYESFSDVGEIRVYFASKILTPCRMH